MAATGNMMSLRTGKPVGSDSSSAFDEGFRQNEYIEKSPVTLDTAGVEESQQQKSGTGWSRVTRGTPQTLAALNSLMAQLQTGGSEEDKFISAARREEIGRARGFQGQFSPEAARQAGTSLISKSISDALAQLMPGITAASEGSGTSKGSMRALLTQRAGERGAIEGAALAANLGSAYGGLQANLEATLNELTKQDPHSPLSQLAQLIIGSKGIVENTDRFEAENSRSTGSKAQRQVTGEQLESRRTNKIPLGAEQQPGGGPISPYAPRSTGYAARTGSGQQSTGGWTSGYDVASQDSAVTAMTDDLINSGVFDVPREHDNENALITSSGSDMETTYTGLTSGSETDIYEGGGGYYDEEY